MTQADMRSLALNLRRWNAAIKFPEDRFFHEDMKDAARALEEAAVSLHVRSEEQP